MKFIRVLVKDINTFLIGNVIKLFLVGHRYDKQALLLVASIGASCKDNKRKGNDQGLR